MDHWPNILGPCRSRCIILGSESHALLPAHPQPSYKVPPLAIWCDASPEGNRQHWGWPVNLSPEEEALLALAKDIVDEEFTMVLQDNANDNKEAPEDDNNNTWVDEVEELSDKEQEVLTVHICPVWKCRMSHSRHFLSSHFFLRVTNFIVLFYFQVQKSSFLCWETSRNF